MKRYYAVVVSLATICLVLVTIIALQAKPATQASTSQFLGSAEANSKQLIDQGRQTFRFDTFGDEAFWTGQLQMQKAVSTLSPATALQLGLKVDSQALTPAQIMAIKQGKLNVNDPAVSLQLIKQNAVLGVVGTVQDHTLNSVGFTCAICHSTVDDSVAPGIGNRIDGLANRDLNIGAIVATAPNLQPVVDLLKLAPADSGITVTGVKNVLNSWGPGKFDAELFLDGKAFNTVQSTNGSPLRTVSGATLLPNARGLSGHNLHTWTGGWGTVTYWNAFVAVNELHGIGTFFDERFDNVEQFPIAAAAKLGHVSVDNPEEDQVTSKLAALHFYQLALPAVQPRPGIDFDPAAAKRGDELFSDPHKANCNRCHREPLWTEPGWNQHSAEEMKIDSFEADRAPASIVASGTPTHGYRTMNLAGIFVRERGLFMFPANKGRFYHDGRFNTLLDVVNSYNDRFSLGLTDQEKHDLVEYLKSL